MKRELERVAAQIRVCKKCRLWKSRKKAVPGEGLSNAEIMFIGQAPGKEEDARGRPFVGRAGKILNGLLRKNKINRKRCFITSVVKCFPPKNRKPKKDEIKTCKSYLLKQIENIRPRIIVLLGEVAVSTLLGKVDLKKVNGKRILIDKIIYIPTYHPAAARFPKIRKAMEKDFRIIRRKI